MSTYQFAITVAVLFAVIFICALLVWLAARIDASERLLMPKRKRLKPSKRPLSARLGDFWAYWWTGGMSLRNAWERSGRVI